MIASNLLAFAIHWLILCTSNATYLLPLSHFHFMCFYDLCMNVFCGCLQLSIMLVVLMRDMYLKCHWAGQARDREEGVWYSKETIGRTWWLQNWWRVKICGPRSWFSRYGTLQLSFNFDLVPISYLSNGGSSSACSLEICHSLVLLAWALFVNLLWISYQC